MSKSSCSPTNVSVTSCSPVDIFDYLVVPQAISLSYGATDISVCRIAVCRAIFLTSEAMCSPERPCLCGHVAPPTSMCDHEVPETYLCVAKYPNKEPYGHLFILMSLCGQLYLPRVCVDM